MDEHEMNERSAIEAVELPGRSLESVLEAITESLHDRFPRFTGVYIYLLEGDTLVLTNFCGPATEHTHIPVGEGVCGRAARVKTTVRVDDVNSDPDYIACSLGTRSELVVPIIRGDQVLGEIDVDSDVPAAFTERDVAFLERLAAAAEPRFPL